MRGQRRKINCGAKKCDAGGVRAHGARPGFNLLTAEQRKEVRGRILIRHTAEQAAKRRSSLRQSENGKTEDYHVFAWQESVELFQNYAGLREMSYA
jgi:hypothetical protein